MGSRSSRQRVPNRRCATNRVTHNLEQLTLLMAEELKGSSDHCWSGLSSAREWKEIRACADKMLGSDVFNLQPLAVVFIPFSLYTTSCSIHIKLYVQAADIWLPSTPSRSPVLQRWQLEQPSWPMCTNPSWGQT
jgi:hypothetical protein